MKLSLFARKLVAPQDIVVYKVVGQFPGSQALQACYYDFDYEINKCYTTQMVREGLEVENGFHSYKDIKSAMMFRDKIGPSLKIVECVIPKGSEYYAGKQRVYTSKYDGAGFVSNSLIIKKVF